MISEFNGKAVKILRLPTVDYGVQAKCCIYAKSDDFNSRIFKLTLYDDVGTVCLKNFYECRLNAQLPSGEKVFCLGEKDGNQVAFLLPSCFFKETGRLVCDVSFQGRDKDEKEIYLTGQTFFIQVEKAIYDDDAVMGEDDYNIIVKLKNEIENVAENFEIALKNLENISESEAERIDGENERKLSENERLNGEKERVESENIRIANEEKRQEQFDGLQERLQNDLESIETAERNAEEIKQIYANFPILLYYDENGYLCYEEKGEN